MTPEAILTLIRLQLKRCPGCGYNVTDNTNVTCPECGRDLTNDAISASRRTRPHDHDQWLKAFSLSIFPIIPMFMWLVIRAESAKRYNIQVKPLGPFFGFCIVLAIVVGIIAFNGFRSDRSSPGSLLMLVAISWILIFLIGIGFLS